MHNHFVDNYWNNDIQFNFSINYKNSATSYNYQRILEDLVGFAVPEVSATDEGSQSGGLPENDANRL